MSAVDMPQVQAFHGTATSGQASIQISNSYNYIFNVGLHVRELVIVNKSSTDALLVAFDDSTAIADGNYVYVSSDSTIVLHPALKNYIYVQRAASVDVAYSITWFL